MIGRVLVPLLVVPVVVLALLGGASYYWYKDTKTKYDVRVAQFRRLEKAKVQLVSLKKIEPDLKRLQSTFAVVTTPTVIDAVRLWLSQNASADKGIEIDSTGLSTVRPNLPTYGSIACRLNVRSNAISSYIAEAMNKYPNLILRDWTLDSNNPKKVLSFSTTIVLLKLE